MPKTSQVTPTSSTWRLIDRHGWPVHIHESDDLWIVQYDTVPGMHLEHWSVYYAIAKKKRGAEPWSRNNKRLGDFPSLELAFAAGEAWFKQRAESSTVLSEKEAA